MKKVLSLLSLVLFFAFAANAQQRKSWDFSKGVSEESRAALDADGAHWTKTVTEGVTTDWTSSVNITGNAMMGEVPVPELEGLLWSEFAATNALKYYGTKIRLQKNCAFTIEGLSAGQQIVVRAQSANATATDRGLLIDNAVDAEGNNSFITLGRDAGAPEGGVTEIVVKVVADGAVKFSTGLSGAPKSGIEILSIIIDGGDKNIKKWNFAWSEATKTQVCAAEDWTSAESDSKNYITGDEIRWNAGEATYDANEDITAGGEAIKELKGLRHNGVAKYGYGLAFDYGTTTDGNNWGPYNAGSYLWVMTANSTITVPNVKAGSTLKIASESHKPSEARGFNVSVNGAAVASATGTSTSKEYTVFEYTIPESEDEFVDVVLKATKGCHLYSIEAEVKDETIVDKNPALGAPVYSIIDGDKIATETANLTMTFPKFKNIEPSTTIAIEGFFGPAELGEDETVDDYMFDGVEGAVNDGITFAFADYCTLEENTAYKFYLTKISVAGYDMLNKEAAEGEELYPLHFSTVGPGIEEKREWNFTTTADQANKIAESIRNNFGFWAVSSKGRYSVAQPLTKSPLYVAAGEELECTNGLVFSMNTANDILIGTPAHNGLPDANGSNDTSNGGNNGKLQFGGGSPSLIIPQCSAGDEVTIKALYASSSGSSLTIINGTCEGETTIAPLNKNATEYKIIVTNNGDLELKSKSVVYNTISIYPVGLGKEKVVYTINATDSEGNVIKEIATGEGQSNDKIDFSYSYYLMNNDGALFTKGAKGSPFSESIVLETGKEVYNVEYKNANPEGFVKAVFCSEAEDLEGTILSTSANCGIRASNAKAAYPDASDITLCTLPAGTYMIKALIWDANKGGGVSNMKFAYGDEEEDVIEILSTGDNMSDCNAVAPITLTEPRQIVWLKDGCDDARCLDAIVIYEYDNTETAIKNIETSADVKTIKMIENGKFVIKTANGTFNAVGARMK